MILAPFRSLCFQGQPLFVLFVFCDFLFIFQSLENIVTVCLNLDGVSVDAYSL